VASKVEVVEGELARDRLGLDPDTYRACRTTSTS
jgi:hypothetical protein